MDDLRSSQTVTPIGASCEHGELILIDLEKIN